ncbi:efflux RND transporter periplasmic adaptor subunit [Mucilaginibacter limnophilus]|uniref:Efflux RND transporter periplasmic adaptor subunit n=1 Tax=Mucilaginibacter limnophilus TaxID=1932778 RepID=A0A3S2URB7_9SPHI|nr:efflux RND transporter periplasmic adaptor subunit [Mucilaginibacter limnophilus]RVU02739.1 efflux RND transporter periplasmic adaptor subunit [Mucilaginibacter limnophilus]
MDRKIEKKSWNSKRIMTITGVSAIILLVAGSIYFTSGKSKLNVDVERITISEIKKGPFQEFIPVNGVVMPRTTIYLDAVEGGRVEKRFVEDGANMKAGEPILKLSNTDLELSLANEETSVFNVLTQMQISRDNAQQNTITKLNQMAEVESALREAERVYKLNKHLYEQKAIGSQEFKKSENEYQYAIARKKLTTKIMSQDTTSTKAQLTQMQESYDHMKSTLALMRKKVGDLIVRAPVDGQLTSLDAEIGQNKTKGQRLGQIDVLSGYKVRVDIDEHYISRVYNGLMAEYNVDNKIYRLKIKKVFTQVTNGRFQVDMEFMGEMPKSLRRGQTLQIRLALSDETQAILVPKGGFYQQTGGNWIFKLNDDGSVAYKVDVQLGRQNPDYYEVLSGLQPGDKVVTSSYDTYGDMQELVLKGEKAEN